MLTDEWANNLRNAINSGRVHDIFEANGSLANVHSISEKVTHLGVRILSYHDEVMRLRAEAADRDQATDTKRCCGADRKAGHEPGCDLHAPSYRIMWQELRRRLAEALDYAGPLTFAEDTFRDGRIHGLMDAEDFAQEIENESGHTPEAHQVAARSEALRWAADQFQEDAKDAPLGVLYEGGPLHKAKTYNVYDQVAKKLRKMADELERSPDAIG